MAFDDFDLLPSKQRIGDVSLSSELRRSRMKPSKFSEERIAYILRQAGGDPQKLLS